MIEITYKDPAERTQASVEPVRELSLSEEGQRIAMMPSNPNAHNGWDWNYKYNFKKPVIQIGKSLLDTMHAAREALNNIGQPEAVQEMYESIIGKLDSTDAKRKIEEFVIL